MTVSCREQIVVAVLAVLTGVTGLTTERNRREPLKVDELPRAILFEGDEEETDTFAGEDSFELPLLLQVAIKEGAAAGATSCNDMRAKLRQALLVDRTLAGKARNLELTTPGDWLGVDVEAEEDTEGFMLSLTVFYATAEGNPFAFSN